MPGHLVLVVDLDDDIEPSDLGEGAVRAGSGRTVRAPPQCVGTIAANLEIASMDLDDVAATADETDGISPDPHLTSLLITA